jgi:hypothetical protein
MGDQGASTARRRKRGKVEITEEMISAAAEVLWTETSLDVSQIWAELLAKRMLQRALQERPSETGEETQLTY